MSVALRVDGHVPVARALRALGVDLDTQEAALDAIADLAESEVARRTPRRTGRLRSDVTARRVGNRAVVTVGRRVIYAGPINYGHRARGIAPAGFLQASDPTVEQRGRQLLDTHADRLITRRGLR